MTEHPTSLPIVDDEDNKPAAIVDTIAIKGSPNRLVINQAGTRLYVASATLPQAITIIDTASRSVINTIGGVGSPIWLALHPNAPRLYVSDNSRATDTPINVIDTLTDTVIGSITGFTTVNGMTLNSNGSRLYVADEGASEVVAINTTNFLRISETAVVRPIDITVAPGGARSHVASHFSKWTSINLGTNNVITQTETVVGVPTTIAHARFSARIYITYQERGEVFIGDTSTANVSQILHDLRGPWQVAFNTIRELAYVTQTDGNEVGIINTRTQEVIGAIDGFDKPRGIVVAPDGRTAYVANIGNASVAVVRL